MSTVKVFTSKFEEHTSEKPDAKKRTIADTAEEKKVAELFKRPLEQ